MNLRSLKVYIGTQCVGTLFKLSRPGEIDIIRFMPDQQYVELPDGPVLSLSMLAGDPELQKAYWANTSAKPFVGQPAPKGIQLPVFFQNLLPEGVYRKHIAEIRSCSPDDYFELLVACGRDLPGNVYALPESLAEDVVARLIAGRGEALEFEVVQEPLEQGVSLSGVQPKLGVLKEGERYVARTKKQDTHIIAKLPVVGQALLPELEMLSLSLAHAAGLKVCEAELAPLSLLDAEHSYDLGDETTATQFLAVHRFDRSPAGRVHVEDFCQILGRAPEEKYLDSYLSVAKVMMNVPSLGEDAVYELLRRIAVNELLGNPDMHLKNIGVIYPDGRTPQLSPAYDVVAYAAYNPRRGHALYIVPPGETISKQKVKANADGAPLSGKPELNTKLLRDFCAKLGIPEKKATAVISQVVRLAVEHWPEMISAAALTERQKSNLLQHFYVHPNVQSLVKRMEAAEARNSESPPLS